MKKGLVILAGIIIAVLAMMPLVNGMVMEKAFTRCQSNRIHGDISPFAHLEILEYHRGLFKTLIRWRIKLDPPVWGINEVVCMDRARHGVLGIASETSLEGNPWFSEWVRTRKGGNPLSIRTRYSPGKGLRFRMRLDSCSADTAGGPLDIGGLDMGISTDRTLKKRAVRGRWEGLDGWIRMGPLTFEDSSTRGASMVWEGKGSFFLESFLREGVYLSDFSCDYEVTASKAVRKMSMAVDMAVGRIRAQGLDLSRGRVQWALKGMDADAWTWMRTRGSRAAGRILKEISAPDTPSLAGMMERVGAGTVPWLMAGGENLLKKGLALSIPRMDLGLPQGRVTGTLEFGLNRDLTPVQWVGLAAMPSLASKIFSLSSHLRLPRDLGRPELIRPLVPGMKTGLFMEDGEILVHRARIRDGRVWLNGEEVTLAF